MNLIDILKNRYSTKQFKPKQKLTDKQLDEIKALLRFSPSSVNLQPWHFILVDSEVGKEKIAMSTTEAFKFNEQKIYDSALSVVFCVRNNVDEDYLTRLTEKEDLDGRFTSPDYKTTAHSVRQGFVNFHIHERKDLHQWMEKQLYLNMGAFLLGVAAMGLDAVAMEGVDTNVLNHIFDLPSQGYRAVAVVSVGYRADDDFNAKLPKSRLPEKDIFTILSS